MKLEPGAKIGTFSLLHRLGRGGMGEVWQVSSPQFDQPIALKILHTLEDQTLARLHREGALQQRIQSPHVVQVLDLMTHEDHPVIVMELVQGPTLGVYARKRHLPFNEIDAIAKGLFAGVHAAHDAGMIHRDLKPSNILLAGEAPNWAAKITDFGLARPLYPCDTSIALTRPGLGMGTPGYMAPEQIQDASRVDQRADCFSIGAILYLLCTGRRAFVGANRFEVLRNTTDGRYTSPVRLRTDIPPRMAAAIRASLQRHPDYRPATIQDLEHLWVTEAANDTIDGFTPVQLETPPHPSDAALFNQTLTLGPLPRVSGETVGRSKDLQALETLLTQHTIVTLLGSGGIGKTRLALEIGRHHPHYTAVFCQLADATDLTQVATAVAQELDIQLVESEPLNQIGNALRSRASILLILDNAEQVVQDVARAVTQWVALAPTIKVLVTSRIPLNIDVEHLYLLGPLSPPDAVSLFERRARRLNSAFSVTEDNREPLTSLVERLDCVPLAIELAAGRVNLLTPKHMLERLNDRFRLLRASGRDLPDRQATLQGAIDWSWKLLDPWAQAAMAQCSVFRGGFTIEAAEAIVDLSDFPDAPWVMDVVHELVHHSLLQVRRGTDNTNRLAMFESIRDYAENKLNESNPPNALAKQENGPLPTRDAVLKRHAQYYATLGQEPFLTTLNQAGGAGGFLLLTSEFQNLNYAVQHSLSRPWAEDGARCQVALAVLCHLRGPFQRGAEQIATVLNDSELPLTLRAKLLCEQGHLFSLASDTPSAKRAMTQGLTLCLQTSNRRLEGILLGNLAHLRWQMSQPDSKRGYLRALEIHKEVGNRRHEAIVLCNLAILEGQSGDFDTCQSLLSQALAIHKRNQDRRLEGVTMGLIAIAHRHQGQLESSMETFERALELHREVGNRYYEGVVLNNLAVLLTSMGRHEQAMEQHQRGLSLCREVGSSRSEANTLGNIALLHAEMGNPAEAREASELAISVCGATPSAELALAHCKVARVEHAIGDLTAARQALSRSETMAKAIQMGPNSTLARRIQSMHDELLPS